jgi:hypothetical protein
MAHFAQLDENNLVTQVIVVSNATIGDAPFPHSEALGIAFCKSLFGDETVWKQTSYSESFRKNYAGIGYVFDELLDAFISPQPFESWNLNTDTCQWEAPIPVPQDGKMYQWNEQDLRWVEINM